MRPEHDGIDGGRIPSPAGAGRTGLATPEHDGLDDGRIPSPAGAGRTGLMTSEHDGLDGDGGLWRTAGQVS